MLAYHYEDNQCDDRDRIDSYGDGLCRQSSSYIPGVFKQFTEVKDENKVDFCESWTEHGTQEISSCFVLACQKRVHNQRLIEEISLKLVRKKDDLKKDAIYIKVNYTISLREYRRCGPQRVCGLC